MTYTEDELLRLWMLRRGLEPLRADAAVTRTDGIDLERLERVAMKTWYLDMLDTAPLEMLETDDITASVVVKPLTDGSVVMTLPDNCVRVVEVKLAGWERPATLISDTGHPLALRQHNPMTRAGICHPVAVAEGRGCLRLYSLRNGIVPQAERVLAVTEPPQGYYRLNPRAVGMIPAADY